MHSEMCPAWQNQIQRTKNCSSKCAYDCAESFKYTIQVQHNSSDNLPSYLQTNITAQMLSVGGEVVLQTALLQYFWHNFYQLYFWL